MKRWLLGLFFFLLSGTVLAVGAQVVRKRAVGSMLVTGWIELAPTGKVAHYDLDQLSKLPPIVAKLIGQTIPGSIFEPVEIDGKPVIAKARMSLRVVADPVGNGDYRIKIVGAQFAAPAGATKTAAGGRSYKTKTPVPYPPGAAALGVSGTVYVLALVDSQGRVDHDLAQQVNLKVVGNDAQMKDFRRLLAQTATKAVKQWTFNSPETGPEAERSWFARIPITFTLNNQRSPAYGQWDVYIPGPQQTEPWLEQMPSIRNDKLIIANVDSTPPDGSFSLASGLHLITKLSGS
jgi:hypothetical protein